MAVIGTASEKSVSRPCAYIIPWYIPFSGTKSVDLDLSIDFKISSYIPLSKNYEIKIFYQCLKFFCGFIFNEFFYVASKTHSPLTDPIKAVTAIRWVS